MHKEKKKITFLLPSLILGGAELRVVALAEALDPTIYHTQLVVLDNDDAAISTSGIETVVLGEKRARNAFGKLYAFLKKERPAIVFTTLPQTTILLYLAALFLPFRPIIVHRVANFLSKSSLGWLGRKLFVTALKNGDRVVCLSHDMAEDLIENFNIEREKISVIYNGIDLEKIAAWSKQATDKLSPERERPVLVTLGKLMEQKGQRYLIEAMPAILKTFPEAQLYIIGEGPKRHKLEEAVHTLKLDEQITFLGAQANPYAYFANADIFILPSLWEGLPSALIEALACGCPVVSTNCQSGPREILDDGRYGVLVPVADSEALANGVLRILTDAGLRDALKARGIERVKMFDGRKMVGQYEDLFLALIKKHG
ncbi:MAG: lipopolysaccharide biosynthesis [uncultured bacterium]|uniref:Lipopolysaccharide biosynthesis n=1 Tax=Candidatus Wolfebacteria bacterium GW2011_GWE2_44_13 TaxID=1619017 RepID=A0A0G1K6R1_9BACT|nr:MAG: lipopolysaccharide biosynthesis [uncultured bacterium]KKT43544.1 MAG: Lipopolysaccharide biosynthesis [Candidatus Wolfebacteria bacterium GW2011_GWE2_44_13]